MGKNFRETLNERMQDPAFRAEWSNHLLPRTVMLGSLGVRNSRPERTGRSPWARSSDTRSVFCARAFSSGVK